PEIAGEADEPGYPELSGEADEPEDPELSGEDGEDEEDEGGGLGPAPPTRPRPVDRSDDALRDEGGRRGELMNDAMGVGLAATQVGVLHRLLIYRVQQRAPVATLINPEIEWSGRQQEILE